MQRRVLHAQLADVLGAAGSEPPVPASIVAYHWAQSCKLPDNSGVDVSEVARVLKVAPPITSLPLWILPSHPFLKQGANNYYLLD